jgi:tetratricopeptide (TPR) repeat protein
MKSISTFAIAAALGGALIASPAFAQKKGEAAAQAPAQPGLKLSKAADKPIRALSAIVTAKDAAGYPAALAAAQAAAQTDEDRFVILRERLNHAINMQNVPDQIAAVEGMLANAVMRPEDKPKFYSALGSLYRSNNDYDGAAAAIEKLVALDPSNTNSIWQLAELRLEQKKPAEAVLLGEQAIKLAKDAGQPVDVKWYRRALDIAYRNKLKAQTTKLARDLFAASREANDRRNALLIYRQYGDLDLDTKLDVLRLMRQAKVLTDEVDIVSFADALALRHYPAEAQAVLNEAVGAQRVKASDARVVEILRTAGGKIAEDKAALPGLATRAQSSADGNLAFRVANGYFGHADYAKAAELYRIAVQKGAPDQELAKLRLGIALAMNGQNAEAETALKAVSGARAGLADYWLLWLSSRG